MLHFNLVLEMNVLFLGLDVEDYSGVGKYPVTCFYLHWEIFKQLCNINLFLHSTCSIPCIQGLSMKNQSNIILVPKIKKNVQTSHFVCSVQITVASLFALIC